MPFTIYVLTKGIDVNVEFCGVVHADNIRRTSVRSTGQVDLIKAPGPGTKIIKKIKNSLAHWPPVAEEDSPVF